MSPNKNNKLAARIVEKFGNQCNFAEAIGWQAPLLNRVINGRRPVSREEAGLIARTLGIRLKDVTG